jgi:UDP-N-acetylmuramoyl-tripeptide--D-alanyl-D-alanine ligase
LLVLGDMRELGGEADRLHACLADAVAGSGAAQIFLCGPHMEALGRALPRSAAAVHRADSTALSGVVADALQPGDVIAVKGSLGSRMKVVVDAIVAASAGEAEA